MSSFRPLTRIHLLLTCRPQRPLRPRKRFPTSDEDSSTPDRKRQRLCRRCRRVFPTSDEDSSTPDAVQTWGLDPRQVFPTSDEDSSTPDGYFQHEASGDIRFPTSDEDSSTPDALKWNGTSWTLVRFRPLTRIHLLLTNAKVGQFLPQIWFPTSDEDSSTPDSPQHTPSVGKCMSFRPLTRIHLLLTQLLSCPWFCRNPVSDL